MSKYFDIVKSDLLLGSRQMDGRQLRAWREAAGYSQEAAAIRFFKVARATLQNWETGTTQVPAAVEAACQIWTRRLHQETASFGPVRLFFRNVTWLTETFDTNAQAVAVAQERWGREDFQEAFINDANGENVWTFAELGAVIAGDDSGAPTMTNLKERVREALHKAIDEYRRGSASLVNTPRGQRLEQLICRLEELASDVRQSEVGYYLVDSCISEIRGLGRRLPEALMSEVDRAFLALNSARR